MKRSKSEYGIRRLSNLRSGADGWLVIIQRSGVIYRRSFGDESFGGKDQSLMAARAFREEIIAKYPSAALRKFPPLMKSSSRSCVIGLSRYCVPETRDLPEKQQRWFWVASCPTPDGKLKRVKFSEKLHGEEQAFKLALKARQAALRALNSSAPARDVPDSRHASTRTQPAENAAQSAVSAREHYASPFHGRSIHPRLSTGGELGNFRLEPE
jgi:hypothetical protein